MFNLITGLQIHELSIWEHTLVIFIQILFIRIKAQIPKLKKLRIHYKMYWGWTNLGYSYRKIPSVFWKAEKSDSGDSGWGD